MKIDVKDFRKNKAAKLDIDNAALLAAAKAAGIAEGAFIKLRFHDGDGKAQGSCQFLGGNVFRVIVRVLPRATYGDAQLYVLNNSLVHEFRHVAQHQTLGPAFNALYAKQNKSVGYTKNKYEVEARYFGRLADHTATKRPDALGKAVWGIRFA